MVDTTTKEATELDSADDIALAARLKAGHAGYPRLRLGADRGAA